MTLVLLDDRRTEGTAPAEVVPTTMNGITFRAGRRTAAHLAWTDDRLRVKGKWLRVIQGCYHDGVTASAGTHDGDGCVDVEVVGMSWEDGQSELRLLGWAAWFRPTTPGLWGAHIHMISLGCPGPVGVYVPGQVDDYYAHLSGLKGHAPDPTWHPDDIESTIFDYPEWEDKLNADDKVWLSNLIDAKLAANNKTLVKSIWDYAVDAAGTKAKAALRKAAGL